MQFLDIYIYSGSFFFLKSPPSYLASCQYRSSEAPFPAHQYKNHVSTICHLQVHTTPEGNADELQTTVTLHSHRQHYHLQGFILLCWNVGWFSPDVLSFLCTNGSLFTAGRPRAPVPIPVRLPVVRPPTEKQTRHRSSQLHPSLYACITFSTLLFPINVQSHAASKLSNIEQFFSSSNSLSLSQPKTMQLKSI